MEPNHVELTVAKLLELLADADPEAVVQIKSFCCDHPHPVVEVRADGAAVILDATD